MQGMAEGRPVVRVHAKRSIAPGEELTFDYGDSYWRHQAVPPVLSTTDSHIVRAWLQSELDSWSLAAGISTNGGGKTGEGAGASEASRPQGG